MLVLLFDEVVVVVAVLHERLTGLCIGLFCLVNCIVNVPVTVLC